MQRETDFCVECREMSSYSLQKLAPTIHVKEIEDLTQKGFSKEEII